MGDFERRMKGESRVIGSPYKALRDIARIFHDPELRGFLFFVAVLLLVGTVFYSIIEDWDLVEAFYFSVASLTTVGYGDLHPTSDLSRLFTSIYILTGVGFLLSLVTTVARLANRPLASRLKRPDTDAKDQGQQG